ncbi:MAG: sensor histidine kinase [Syntrophorhabdales bacterium]|jgi:sensor histidine kinase YesM
MFTERASVSWKHHFNPFHLLMEFLYVVIIDILIAVFLSATGISNPFAVNLLMSQCYGLSIFGIISLLLWVFKPQGGIGRIALIVAIGVAGGNLIGGRLGVFILRRVFSITLKGFEAGALPTIVLVVALGATVSYFFWSKARLRVDKEIIQQERIRRLSSEKETLAANLRLLQAQIEPHFLFNTLSNVLSLIDTDPTRGKAMLADLIRYLRTSLSRTRPATTTLGQEMEMIRSYLSIQKVRMGERLTFAIDLPVALSELPFPPMLLQPLVENAVKHGLDPRVEGGEIAVKVTEDPEAVKVTIADTGAGFSTNEGNGIGLANVRERIRLMYEDRGRLFLEENTPRGVKAIVEVPKNGL